MVSGILRDLTFFDIVLKIHTLQVMSIYLHEIPHPSSEQVNGNGQESASRELLRMMDELQYRLHGVHRKMTVNGQTLKPTDIAALKALRTLGDTATVGELQRALEVQPAQMSRIIRSLENRETPLIKCTLHPSDKRKIDVSFTHDGRAVLDSLATQGAENLERMLTEGEIRGITSAIRPLMEKLMNGGSTH